MSNKKVRDLTPEELNETAKTSKEKVSENIQDYLNKHVGGARPSVMQIHPDQK
jgi:hypothetical protein